MSDVTYRRFASKIAGRTGWQAIRDDRVIATGFCDVDKFPGEAIASVESVDARPYEAIRKTFLPPQQGKWHGAVPPVVDTTYFDGYNEA